jgi:hypothetical protein
LEGPITRVFGRFAQDLEASLDLLTDSANGLGKGDDIYAALEALREINAMGGEGAARTDDKYKVLLARFGEMNETLKEQARLMLENEKVAGFVARGLLSAAEAEPIYQTIRDEWERIAEATEWAAKEEGERVAQAQLTAEALEEQERQMKKMMGDEDSLRKKLAERLEASKSLEEQIATAREEGRRILKDNRAESFDDLQKKLAGAETTSEQVAILKDTERLFQLMEKINKLSEENAGDREKADAIKQQAEESQKRYATEMEILRATLDGDQSKLDSIDRARRIEEEILRLKKEQLNITDKEAARLATAKADAQDAIRERAGEKDTAKKRASEIKLGQEMEVLRLRAAGREKEAEALKKEFEARAEAIRLAEQTNMTEEKALAFVRQRQQLESQIERNKATGENTAAGRRPRSRIYKKDGPSGADSRLGAETTAWGTKLWRADLRPGLGPVAVDRAREARPRDPNEAVRKAATDYYQKNLQQNEELLNIWRTLGVA